MTRAGSNDRKAKARALAASKEISRTEAHALLLAAKNRIPRTGAQHPTPSPASQEHDIAIQRTPATGEAELLEGDEATYVLWHHDDATLRSACICGWTNPYPGPRFPAQRDPYGIESAEQKHWRWYHLAAWARHADEAAGEPWAAEAFRAPDLNLTELHIGLLLTLRLELDHTQDDPEHVAATYTSIETAVRQERLHRSWIPAYGGERPAAADFGHLPEDLSAGLDALVHRFSADRRVPMELQYLQLLAGELRRLAIHTPQPAETPLPGA
ncbi:hypothetical protein [Streptomyces sp. NPDC050988]|uniref:hypothetical protein n=1 Tax=Streptomyces sp. NPDC050988 TaxID=3365637 RepID=UPI003795C7A6